MTIKDEFKEAALEVFNEFDSITIEAVYVSRSGAYEAGGSSSAAEARHDVRLIRDTFSDLAKALADVSSKKALYLLIVDELPIEAKSKDYLEINNNTFTIDAVEVDPADALYTLTVVIT